jgi:hypothetical protein
MTMLLEGEILPPLEKTTAREKIDSLLSQFDRAQAAGAGDATLMILALQIALAEEEAEVFDGAMER